MDVVSPRFTPTIKAVRVQPLSHTRALATPSRPSRLLVDGLTARTVTYLCFTGPATVAESRGRKETALNTGSDHIVGRERRWLTAMANRMTSGSVKM